MKNAIQITAQEVREKLQAEHVTKFRGVFTYRRGFYYRLGLSAARCRDALVRKLPGAIILDYGEHYAPFRGGAGVAENSHFYVKFVWTPELAAVANLHEEF